VRTLYLDTETYCETPLRAGVYRYAEAVEIMIVTWAIDEAPAQAVDLTRGERLPPLLLETLADGDVRVVMHNAEFDRTVLREALDIDIPLERIHDTMARARLHSLPGSLGALCAVLGVPADKAKDKEGGRLIRLFCQPGPKNRKLRRATWHSHTEDWEKFIAYALSDIDAMREVYKRLPRWNWLREEVELWRLDQRVNERGFRVDTDLVEAAIAAVAARRVELSADTGATTEGLLASTSQRDRLLAYLVMEHGVQLPDLRAETLERALRDSRLPDSLRDLLEQRLEASTASVAKYQAVARSVSRDGRLRGTLTFAGASRTGRWAGRIFQPQNLPRPALKAEEIETGIAALKAGAADVLGYSVMELCSSAVRGLILPSEGRHLVVSDLSNIEGRVAAWLAGEGWKVEAFRAYDAGEGPDLYKLAYAAAFGLPVGDVSKDQRSIGKVFELMLAYQGGVGAFLTGAANLRFDVEAMAKRAYPDLPAWARVEAEDFLAWTQRQERSTFGVSDRAFVVCDAFKRLWRRSNPEIADIWAKLDAAVRAALDNPGELSAVGAHLSVAREGPWLRILLPSGRSLCYPSVTLNEKGRIAYMGSHQLTRQWTQLTTYGGKLFENICQAVARDVLREGMVAAEGGGFDILLTVHDEVIAEAGRELTSKQLSSYMASQPRWAAGLPLAAAGFEAERYRKDD